MRKSKRAAGSGLGERMQLANQGFQNRALRTDCREPNFSSKVRIPQVVSALYPYLVSCILSQIANLKRRPD
ncbi:hypothetical protein CSHISOI_03105 [Colletotrichum shisoi]|uniref:Uncharacterized protein n=1 Tax=Colletotrichum shisoi TaxID=2078593 RepID=A0A5Q4BZ51_9PEZI|nr:hypothetical protein CSHISOI_03105 [Colletotrichum shisoi]